MTGIQRIKRFSKFFKDNSDKRILVIYGGAGSGKSVATAQEICLKFIQGNGVKILVTRKTLPSLRITAYQMIMDTLDEMNIPYRHNKSEMKVSFNGNEILFKSLDDSEKIKSLSLNYVWVEEATDISKEDFMQINLRLRAANSAEENKIYLTFNPVDAYHWIITDLVEQPTPEMAICHSTYKNNRFLPESYVNEIKHLMDVDENFYRIYALGEPGVLQNKIYTHFKFEDPKNWRHSIFENGSHAIGIDFGYNAPMAVVEVWCHEDRFYLRERLYESGMTNGDLIRWMQKEGMGRQTAIFCDSAEPDRIEEICNAGFNAHPAKKDVKAGIDYVKAHEVHVDATCSPSIQKEVQNYKYKEDKNGNVLDEPVKAFDHILDACRYAMFSMQTEQPKRISAKVKAQRNRYAGFGTASKPIF